jgi:hypothetical protein
VETIQKPYFISQTVMPPFGVEPPRAPWQWFRQPLLFHIAFSGKPSFVAEARSESRDKTERRLERAGTAVIWADQSRCPRVATTPLD